MDLFKETIDEFYKINEKIGEGGFCNVFSGVCLKSYKNVALKVLDKTIDSSHADTILSEIQILKIVNHKNIIKMYEHIETNEKIYLILELAYGGELFDHIIKRGYYCETDAAKIIYQILSAVTYLHSLSIIHRDIKPENLLFYSNHPNSKIMLTDFGLATYEQEGLMTSACGTPGYVAPEVLKMLPYGKSVDCWSIGVVAYILLCGYPPFYDDENAKLFRQIVRGIYHFHSPYWDTISQEAKNFVSNLLEVSVNQRMTCQEALEHGWLGRTSASFNIIGSVSQQLIKTRAMKNWRKAINAIEVIRRFKTCSLSEHVED